MRASVEHPENNVCLLQVKNKLVQKTNKKLTTRSSEEKTEMERSVEKLVKSVATRIAGVAL